MAIKDTVNNHELVQIGAALNKLAHNNKLKCIDPFDVNSRMTPKQEEVFKDVTNLHVIVKAGNQCLAENTEVITTKGIKYIQDIKVGDYVYDEKGNPIRVIDTFSNGIKEVHELTNRNMILAEATKEHVFLTKDSSKPNRPYLERNVGRFRRDIAIKRVEVNSGLGDIQEDHAYIIGAIAGDGCCRDERKDIIISSSDEAVVKYISDKLNTTYNKQKGNYSWNIKATTFNYYEEWLKGKYAHEKIIDLDIIKTWNRESLLNLVAGIIDTDGSIYVDKWNTICIRCEMQAINYIEVLQYAFIALWQAPSNIQICDRDKYVNGATHTIKLSNNIYTKRALKELTKYLKVERKQWKTEYNKLESKKSNKEWIGIKVKGSRRVNTYDIYVNSDTNLYLLANGLVTHNSGKSQLCGKIMAHKFDETHPYWRRKPDWKNEPLLFLVVLQESRHIEEIFRKKIEPFLTPGSYKITRAGYVISSVIHNTTGNKILFFTHFNPTECRRAVQGYVAHGVWLDEMPSSFKLIEELHRRINRNNGQFHFSFTPKIVDVETREYVDTPTSIKKVYSFNMLDNPAYKGREHEILESIGTNLAPSLRKAILEGDWYIGDGLSVFNFEENHTQPLPMSYSRVWRHVAAIDPATSGKSGFLLVAENPDNGVWFVIKEKYIQYPSLAPSDLVNEFKKEIHNYNVVRCVSDNEPWFIQAAYKQGLMIQQVPKKTTRKKELIKQVQEKLNNGTLKICPECKLIQNEFATCQWSESIIDRIVGSTRFHLLDSLRYAVDVLPKYEPTIVTTGSVLERFQKEIVIQDKERRVKEKKKKQNLRFKNKRRIIRR